MPEAFQPYIGPRPFESRDQAIFFGRDGEANEIISLISSHNVLLIHAQSGAGKTSLLNAKLIPMLIEDEGFEVFPVVRGFRGAVPAGIRPEEITNTYVFNTLLRWAGRDGTDARRLLGKSLAEALAEAERTLDEDSMPRRRALIFDQFEEFFTLYPERPEDRKGFFHQLGVALEGEPGRQKKPPPEGQQPGDPLLHVVILMREDYIAHLHPYVTYLPDSLRTRFRLEPLRREAALAAVEGPLRGTIYSFAPNVAERLVEDLLKTKVETPTGESMEITGEFVEPLQLQVVCQSLLKELPPNVSQISAQHLLQYGDTDRALAKFYEDAIRAASEETGIHQNGLRQWVEEWLITTTGTRGFVHRNPQWPPAVQRAVDILAAAHLIRSEYRAGAYWYELTHDRFVRPIQASNERWNKLREEKATEVISMLDHAAQLIAKSGESRDSGRTLSQALADCQAALDICALIEHERAAAFAHSYMGHIHFAQAQYDKALASYTLALKIKRETGDSQDSTYLLQNIGDIYFILEDFPTAAAVFGEIIRLAPEEAAGYRGRAAVRWYLGDYDWAVKDYGVAIKLNPADAHGYNGRGQCLADVGQYKAALEDLDRAVKLGAGVVVAYARNGRGLAYAGLGRFDEALAEFAASLSLAPDNAWVYFNRARAYEWMGQPQKAVADYRTALQKKDPGLSPAKRAEAEARLRKLLQSDA